MFLANRELDKREKWKKENLTKHSADAHHCLEDGIGEADPEPQCNAVGQTQS